MEKREIESKYKAQIKHLRKKYKRITIDFRIEDLEKFKEICKNRKTTPTAEIKKFVKSYIDNNI